MGVMIPSDSSGHKHFHFGTPWIFVLDGDQFLSSGEVKRWQERTTVIGSRRHVGQGPDESKEPFKQKSRMLGLSVPSSCLHLLYDSVRQQNFHIRRPQSLAKGLVCQTCPGKEQ